MIGSSSAASKTPAGNWFTGSPHHDDTVESGLRPLRFSRHPSRMDDRSRDSLRCWAEKEKGESVVVGVAGIEAGKEGIQ